MFLRDGGGQCPVLPGYFLFTMVTMSADGEMVRRLTGFAPGRPILASSRSFCS
jgi:hypothetical protein